MTKKDYLNKLATVLHSYDEETKNEILSDYEEHFRLGLAEGKSEEEIIESLGGFDELAGILEENPQPKEKENHSPVSEKETNHVVVHGYTANVYVKPSRDSKINAQYVNHGSVKEQLMYSFKGYQEDDTFVIRLEERDRLMNFFRFGNQPEIEIFLEIPENLHSLTIKTLSGDIEVNDIRIESLSINTASGDIELDRVVAQTINGNSASGDIDLKHSMASLIINTASGDLSISKHDAKDVKITSASGDIDFHGGCDVIECKTASGDADLNLSRDCKVSATAVSGDIDIRLHKEMKISALSFSTVSGDIQCSHPSYPFRGKSLQYEGAEPGTSIRVNTVSGDVEIE